MQLDEIPTPALVLNAATVRRNLDRMAKYSAAHHIGVRPHTKTHKSRKLGVMQIEAGCIGLTVAKTGEADVMAEATNDLLIAYPALDAPRAKRIAELARKINVRVAVDSAQAAKHIGQAAAAAGTAVGILVDLDVGQGRTGVQSPEAAWQLAEVVMRTRGLRLDGIMCYPGQVWAPIADQPAALAPVSAKLAETIDLWKKHGVAAEIVSGGSTPTAYQSHHVPQYTEIRPGTYIFNDLNTWYGGYCTLDDCAARIIATVVSTAVPGQVVIDAGTKTLTSDRCHPAPESGHGYVVEYPQAKAIKLSEEHGQIDVRQCDRVPQLGERVSVIPNHICPCVNLQDSIWWQEADGRLESLTVDARGKLS